MGDAPSNLRRRALLEAIGYLEYRVAVCRDAEAHFSVENGHKPIASATERAARMELELAVKEIARLANLPRRSREYRRLTEERARYIADRALTATLPSQDERSSVEGSR